MIKKNRTFIIAEAGVNHNGSYNLAKKLIDAAKYCDADAVKFQTFNATKSISKFAKKIKYQKKNEIDKISQLNMLKKLELSNLEFVKLKKYCKKKKILFLSTPKSIDDARFLNKIGMRVFKIGSGDILDFELLNYISKTKKKVILSTGMSTLKEIKKAVKCFNKKKITLLHCVSLYPTPINLANLKTIPFLKKKLGIECGFSDHTLGFEASLGAVSLGAHVIEKHLTINKKLSGPDHKTSLTVSEFKNMVLSIRNMDKALGESKKVVSRKEKQNIKLFRRGLVFNKDLKKNSKVQEDDISTKRPLTGLEPIFKKKLIGKTLKKDVFEDQPILKSFFK